MSLFGAVQSASNSLRVTQLGLQVVGNNIANVNTPGYIRQELVQVTAPGYKAGGVIIGQGVIAQGVQQKLDTFVVDRMRQVQSQLSYQEQLESTNSQVESLLNELSDTDLSSSFSRFSNSFQDIANQPGSESVRSLALQRGRELASQFKNLSNSMSEITSRSTQEIRGVADEINKITDSIAKLNIRIVEMEGGALSSSDAVGLRDERLKALDDLSQLVDVTASEQANGAVTVLVGGDYLVADGIPRTVQAVNASSTDGEDGASVEIRFADTDAKLNVSGGKLRGLYESLNTARESGFQGKLDSLARDVIRVVNRIHSQGQGTRPFSSITSESTVNKPLAALEQSNPEFDIDNGSFQIQIKDAKTGVTKTQEILVKQQGLASDTSATQLVASIDAIDGLSARLTNDGRVEIKGDSDAIQFSFANDTSGALAALGINTFFTGDSANSIEVRAGLVADPTQLAVSKNGVGNGADNALQIAEAFTKSSDLLGGRSLSGIYDALVSDTTREINTQRGVTDGLRNFHQTLEAKHLGSSGVNLDEEAVKMMLFQRSFQATSKLVSTASEMLDALVNMI